MAIYRTIPFGYQMVDITITPHPQEKEIVLEIFQQYARGESYLTIAKELSLKKVEYLPEKIIWNKNMVARILQNEAYMGDEEYPPLLSEEEFKQTQLKLKPKKYSISPEIKFLKRKTVCEICDCNLERKLEKNQKERWKCPNDLDHISIQFSDKTLLEQVEELWKKQQPQEGNDYKNNLRSTEFTPKENFLKEIQIGVDIEQEDFMVSIMELAAEKYKRCQKPNIGYEPLILENISKLAVKGHEVRGLYLKNGAIIRTEG